MDNFEKHIRKNAEVFDTEKVDKAKLWAAISNGLDKSEEPKVLPLWKRPALLVAASILLVFGIAGFIGLSIYQPYNSDTQFVSKELLDIDQHYQGLVSYQVELVNNSPHLTNLDKEEFLSFMDELDAEYEALRQEMRTNLDNERVLEAIVGNYKKRIELIENLLQQINEAKKSNGNDGYTL